MTRPQPQTPRALTWLAWGSLVAAMVVLFGIWPRNGGDFLMWLTVGRWTWEHGWPPMVDVWSYTTPGAEFLAHSWLAATIFYLLDTHIGVVGTMLLRLMLVSVACVCAVQTARLLQAPWSSILLIAPVVLAILWGRLETRPYLFSTAFLAFELWLLLSVHTGHPPLVLALGATPALCAVD